MSEIDLVAIADRSGDALESTEVTDGVRSYSELDDMLNAEKDLQALVVCTNGPSHAPICINAMERGIKRLFVSKPLACSIEDSRRIIEKAQQTGTRIVVDHGLRHDHTYNWIRQKVDDGSYGNLRSVYIQRPGIGLGCLGVHSFDLANVISGKAIERVTAWVDEPIGKNPRGEQFVDPGGLVILEHEGGLRSVISQIEDGSGPMSVELNFQFARMRVDAKYKTLEVVSKDPEFVPGPGRPAPLEKAINPHDRDVDHNIFDLMKALLSELAGEGPIKASADCGYNSIEVLVAAYASNDNGNRPVSIPVDNEEYRKLSLPIT